MKAIHLVSALSLLVPTLAYADSTELESTGFDHSVAPVKTAFELGVGTGYTQGGGKLGGDMSSLEDVSGAGVAVEVDAGVRIARHLSLGLYGTFSQYQHGDSIDSSTNVLGATAGIQAVAHLRPDMSIDPWVSLGTGWRGLWLDPSSGKATSLQGFELARLQVGVDYRVSKDISIAPVIGASLSTFVAQDSAMTTDYTEIADKKVNFIGFAGLSGRFDLGGSR